MVCSPYGFQVYSITPMGSQTRVVFLIRHAQSIGNLESGRINTQKDKRGLTKKGARQANHLATEINKTPLNFAKIFSSPLNRTIETASIIGQRLDIPVTTDDRLLDIDRGIIDGLTYSEIRERYPEVVKQWQTAPPGKFAPPQGESFEQLIARVEDFLRSVNKEHALIISHQDTIYAMLFALLKIPLEYLSPARSLFHVDNATATAVLQSADQVFIPFVNRNNQLDKAYIQSQTDREDLKTIARDVCTRAVGISSFSYNNNYIVQTKKGTHLFVKFFQSKYLAKLERELQIITYLKKQGFSVTPGTINQTQHQCYFVKPFIHRYSLLNWWRWGLTEKEKKRTLKLAAEDLARIHELTPPIKDFWQFPQDKVTNFADWCAFLTKKIAGDFKVIQQNKLLSAELLRRLKTTIQQEFTHYRQQPVEAVRLHGDFHLDNILLDKDKLAIELIDFGNARVGDGLWDLANMFKISFAHDPTNKNWQHFFSHYLKEAKAHRTQTERTLNFFCLLNFTGSLKTQFEKQNKKKLQEELILLMTFLGDHYST